MNQKKKIIVSGLVVFAGGFVLLKWYILAGLGLIASSWFVFDNLWVLEPNQSVNWPKVIKRVAAFLVLGFLTDILLQI